MADVHGDFKGRYSGVWTKKVREFEEHSRSKGVERRRRESAWDEQDSYTVAIRGGEQSQVRLPRRR